MRSTTLKVIILQLYIIFLCFSCKKFLDVGNPRDKIPAEYVYGSDANAIAVVNGIYYDFQRNGGIAHGNVNNISTALSLGMDECDVFPTSSLRAYYTNTRTANFWTPMYNFIYRINTAIYSISKSESISASIKEKLLGECKFLRGFFYFYLVNLYGDVPLLLTPSFKDNAVAFRTPQEKVYEQVIDDLLEAQDLLGDDYLNSDMISFTEDRIRPCKWAAVALLARVYLYTGDYSQAIRQSTLILNNRSLFDTTSLDEVFLKNSKEAIWQLQPISDDGVFLNTFFPKQYVLLKGEPNSTNPISVGRLLVESFEKTDRRKSMWLGVDSSKGEVYYYFHKYKYYGPDEVSKEYIMVLRLAEQYLIRAEAKAQLGDLDGAIVDLNVIRLRAGLEPSTPTSLDEVKENILEERKVELFVEWGDRWFNLKRLRRIDEVMKIAAGYKKSTWESYRQLYPIPIEDLKLNTNLTQNAGYPSF